MQEIFGLSNTTTTRNMEVGGTNTYVYYTHINTQPMPGGQSQKVYVVGDSLTKIEFNKGFLTVEPGQEDLLLFLRSHEQNKTNTVWSKVDGFNEQIYKPTKAFLFKEIIPEKEDAASYDLTHNRLKAQTAAFDPKRIPMNKAIVMATAYGLTDAKSKGEKGIRKFLYDNATANPDQFLTDMASNAFELKATVQSALSLRIIKFDAPYIQWTDRKAKKFAEGRICQVSAGMNPIDFFVQWLREKDKSGVMDELKRMVDEELEDGGTSFESDSPSVDLALEAVKAMGYNTLEEAMFALAQLKASNATPTPQGKGGKGKGDKGVVIAQ